MSIPTGYEKLAVIGIAWKNEYVQGTAYKTMNAVYYNGSTYVALRDNPTGPPAADGANWQYLAKGFEQQLLSAITALDTSGVLGQAGATVGGQALMDAIADKVMTKLIAKSQIVNNLLATEPGNVLDATQGKALKDDITELYSDLTDVKTGSYTAISNSYVSISAGVLRKVGKICQLYLTLNIQQTGGAYTSFATIPNGFLPAQTGYFDLPKCTIQIKANQLGINATATGSQSFYITYIAAE